MFLLISYRFLVYPCFCLNPYICLSITLTDQPRVVQPCEVSEGANIQTIHCSFMIIKIYLTPLAKSSGRGWTVRLHLRAGNTSYLFHCNPDSGLFTLLDTMTEHPQKANPFDISLVLGKAGMCNTLAENYRPCLQDSGFSLFKRAVQGPFHDRQGTPSYGRDVLNSGLRVVTAGLTIHQAQYAQPSTETAYKLICRAHGRKPSVVDLGNGAKGLWIGRSDAEYVMLYIHGMSFLSKL